MKLPNRNIVTLTNDVGLWNRVFEHETIVKYPITNQCVGSPNELLQKLTQQEFCFCIIHFTSNDGIIPLIKQISDKTAIGILLVGLELPKSDIINLLHLGVCNVIEQESIEEIVPALVTTIKRNMAVQSIGAQYKSVVDHALSAFILGKPNGEILDASLRAEEMFGYSIDELRQIGRTGIIDHASINAEELLRKRMADGKLVTQAVGLKKDGERFPIEISSVLFYDETNGEYRTSTLITDISEKEELKALLSQTTEIAKVGGWEWILETNRLSWTNSTKKIHNLPESYVPSVNEAISFYIEEHRPIVEEAVQKCVTYGEPFDLELTIVNTVGERIEVRSIGKAEWVGDKVYRIYGTIQDISERKNYEVQIKNAADKLRAYFDSTADSICILNADMQVMDFNRVMENETMRLLNHAVQLGDSFLNYVPEAVQPYFIANFNRALNGEHNKVERFVGFSPTQVIWVSVGYYPVRDEIGNIIGVAIATKDITERKRLETTLRIREQELAQIFNTINDTIYVLEVEQGNRFKYININAAFERLTGLSILKRIGKYVHEVDDNPSMDQELKHYITAVEKQQEVNWIESCVYASGKKITSHTVKPIVDESGNCYRLICTATDITDQVSAEQEIRKLSLFAKQTTNGAIITDVSGNAVWVNESFQKISGYRAEEIIGKTAGEFNQNSKVPAEILAQIMHAVQHQEVFEAELEKLKKDGTAYWVKVQGQPMFNERNEFEGYFTLETDITDKKKEEQHLKLLESVIHSTSEMVIVTDNGGKPNAGLMDLKVVYVNKAFEKVTGYTKEEIIGKSLEVLSSPNSNEDKLMELDAAIREGRTCELEYEAYRKSGESYWINISASPIVNSQGVITNWISVERDVTKRKLQEEERTRLIEELSRKNSDLRQFAYITSHNLRSPVTNMMAIANMIEESELSEDLAELISGFKKSTHNLNETLYDLIQILLIKESSNIPVDLIELEFAFEKMHQSLSQLIQEHEVQIQKSFEVKKVKFSSTYFDSILQNLITNSIKYRSPHRTPQIKVVAKQERNKIKMVFSDNGLGMDMNIVKNRIFGLYQKFHNHKDSKGIGLYLVKSQVEALGGSIEVESTLGEGTTFTIWMNK